MRLYQGLWCCRGPAQSGSGQIFPNLEPDFGSGSEAFANPEPEPATTEL